jgi:CRP/FNR family transcriptional regulator, cyclic AMP receptor protein
MATKSSTSDSLLSILPAELSTDLFGQARTVNLARNQILFLSGDPADGCYLVHDGLLKVNMVAPSGAERVLAILGSGTLVGELSMIDGAPRSASVTAIRDSKLGFISRATFDAFTRTHPDIYRHMTSLLARRLRDVDDVLTATSLLPLKGRVARALLSLSEAFGKDVGSGRILINQKVSQADIAAMAGIARENVSRILQEWTRQALVSRLAGYYCLENKAALQREQNI